VSGDTTLVVIPIEPILRRCGTGPRWLALSAPESPVQIGVIGDNETDARDLYRRREAAWLAPETNLP
jgi:hypothetical protein